MTQSNKERARRYRQKFQSLEGIFCDSECKASELEQMMSEFQSLEGIFCDSESSTLKAIRYLVFEVHSDYLHKNIITAIDLARSNICKAAKSHSQYAFQS